MSLRIFLLSCFLFNAFSSISQDFKLDRFTKLEVEEMNRWNLLKYDGINAFNGVAYSYSRPLHWTGKDWTRAGATVGLVGALYFVDGETSDYFRKQSDDIPETIREFGNYFGSPQNNYGLNTGIYLYGLISKDEEWRRTGVLMLSSATAAGLIQQLTKSLTGRGRPETEVGTHDFRPFSGQSGFRSFPSGHTVLSVTTAYALSKHFDSPWVKGGIYAVGLISPVSRLWRGAHFLTDVVLSTVITIATVEAVDRYLDSRNGYGDRRYGDPTLDQKVSWNFNASFNSIGVSATF